MALNQSYIGLGKERNPAKSASGQPANIYFHLTDFCNQNCSFCFAREEMTKANKKQISFDDFKKYAVRLKKMGVLKLDFLGGEPTLHPEFDRILKYALKHFFYVRIYTNGIFSAKVRDTIADNPSRITLIVNISTPGFLLNKKIRDSVIQNIDYLTPKIPTILSVVSLFMNQSAIDIFKQIPVSIIKKTKTKLSFMSPQANDKNPISINDFPKVGKNLIGVVKQLEKIGPPLQIRFNKMFRPCMFNQKQIGFLKKRRLDFISKNVECHNDQGKTDLFHIASDLSTFKCYPLSTVDKYTLKTESLTDLQKKYYSNQLNYRRDLILPECRNCPFFGFEKGRCSGPCIAFRINALKEKGLYGQKAS